MPLSQIQFSDEDKARLDPRRRCMRASFSISGPRNLSQGEGSVMVKDETICIRCGLCAERCPAHTITMEAFEVFDRDPDLVSIEGVTLRP